MRKTLLGIGVIIAATNCGSSEIPPKPIPKLEAINAPSTTLVVDDTKIYLAIRKAEVEHERASRSAQRTTTTTQVRRGVFAEGREGNGGARQENSEPVRSGDIWTALAKCESNGNPNAVSRNGLYFGAYQFSLATWRSIGETGRPTDYSYGYQLAAAKRLQARSGWGQWPACSRKLNLR